MIGTSLYIGENIRLTSIDPEKDAAALSLMTEQHGFDRRFNYGLYRFIPEIEMKKMLEERFKKAEGNFREMYFAVRRKDSEDLLAFARLDDIYAANQAGSVFIDFGLESHLQECGKEVLTLMARYAFMELSLYRLQTSFSAYESELIKLYEQFGFKPEVRRREAVFHAGRHWDTMIYGLLRPEYFALTERGAQ
jgi:RimJ/RimL family protein N-acetyltransferase